MVKSKTTPASRFKNETEERAYWESHDSTAYLDWSKAEKVLLPNLKLTVFNRKSGGKK
jgi:CopG antitoxin of type II toxin-antitoxin system